MKSIKEIGLFILINTLLIACNEGEKSQKTILTKNTSITAEKSFIFESTGIWGAISYGASPANNENLLMDIYEPFGDTLKKRSLIIIANEKSEEGEIVGMANSLARAGYVVAHIKTQKPKIPNLPLSIKDETNTVQENMKAVAHYFQKDHATVNLFRVDTNSIFMSNLSASLSTRIKFKVNTIEKKELDTYELIAQL